MRGRVSGAGAAVLQALVRRSREHGPCAWCNVARRRYERAGFTVASDEF